MECIRPIDYCYRHRAGVLRALCCGLLLCMALPPARARAQNLTSPTVTGNLVYGGFVNLTCTLTYNNGYMSGMSVTFYVDNQSSASATTSSSGSATATISSLNAGTHYAYCKFQNITGGTATFYVAQASTSVGVATSNPSINYGTSVTFTGSISSGRTGTIGFCDGRTLIGSRTINSGSASFTTTALTAGNHSISAFWPGTLNYAGAQSVKITQTVGKSTPALNWSPPAAIPYGTPLGGNQLDASASIPGTYSYSPGPGTILDANEIGYTLSVTFTPFDSTDYNSVSGTVLLKVNPASPSSFTIASSTTQSSYLTPVTFSATISPGPAGEIFFYDEDAWFGEGAISGTTATFTAPQLTPGKHIIHAVWPGDRDWGPATTSNSVSLTVTAGNLIYAYSVPSGGFDGAGNLVSYSDTVMGAWNLSYDTLERLSGGVTDLTSDPTPYYCWSYDGFGNRLQQESSSLAFLGGSGGPNTCQAQSQAAISTALASVDTNNRVMSTNARGITALPTYDASGDMLTDGVNQYLYDAEGRVCAVASGSVMTGYLYDADGARVAKGNITTLSCDPSSNGFQTASDFVLGPGGEQDTELSVGTTTTWTHTNVWAAGQLLATYDNSGTHFYFDDPLGTRRVQTDPSGGLPPQQSCFSLPFGDQETCSPSPTEHLFTGKERDAESGNDYFGARYYASTMGRFLSPDWSSDPEAVPFADIGNPQSLNLYAYVNNNPLRSRDPDGHSRQECVTFKILDTGVSVTTCTTVPDWRDLPMLAGIAWGHHGIPRSLFRFLPEGEARTWLQREFITGPLEGGHGWSKAHKLYNEAVKKLLKLDTAEGRQQLLDEGLDGAKEAARTVLNSNDPNIKGFLDGMKTPDGLTGRQALEGALEGDEGALLDVVIDGAAGLAAVD